MNRRALSSAVIVLVLWPLVAAGQTPAATGGGGRGRGDAAATPAVPPKPAPRGADGRPVLGTMPGEVALWLPAAGGGERFVNADTAEPVAGKLRVSEVPMLPWARAVFEDRLMNQLEPHTRCRPSGGPRQFLTPYGVEILEMPSLQQIIILDLGGPHTYRQIYMDGRPHPANLTPSYYGHSVGRWDGDTLVIDTIGFNEKFWLDRQGTPHTEKLHMIEKLTRTDYNTIKYDVTIEDPGAYSRVWSSTFNLRWVANSELFEYICQDNNYASDLMVGSSEFVDRTSKIVP